MAIMNLNGCQEHCAESLHDLSKYDILVAHSNFASADQCVWIYDYFNIHCPYDEDGKKNPTKINFFVVKVFAYQCGLQLLRSVTAATMP